MSNYKFTVPTNTSNVTMKGHFTASGGNGSDIQVVVVNEDEYVNWHNGHPTKTFYNSGKVTQDANIDSHANSKCDGSRNKRTAEIHDVGLALALEGFGNTLSLDSNLETNSGASSMFTSMVKGHIAYAYLLRMDSGSGSNMALRFECE